MVVVSVRPIFNSFLPIQKPDGAWRVTGDNHKANQVLALIIDAVNDVVLLLQHINKDSVHRTEPWTGEMYFLFYLN